MKTIYAIRDRVANDLVTMQMYALFTFKTDQQAVRYFADALLEPTSILNKHPGDYELIACGRVHDNGQLELYSVATDAWNPDLGPKLIMTGDALMAAQKPELVREA